MAIPIPATYYLALLTNYWYVSVDGDEVHLSVRWLLDMLHLARPSRPCKYRPRPCSRRLPTAGVVFVFLSFLPNRPFARIKTYLVLQYDEPEILSCTNPRPSRRDRLLSSWTLRPKFECVTSCFVLFFVSFWLFQCKIRTIIDDDWSVVSIRAIEKSVLDALCVHVHELLALLLLLCVLLLFFLFLLRRHRDTVSQQSIWTYLIDYNYTVRCCTTCVRVCIEFRIYMPAAV